MTYKKPPLSAKVELLKAEILCLTTHNNNNNHNHNNNFNGIYRDIFGPKVCGPPGDPEFLSPDYRETTTFPFKSLKI
jgi:hypothetical protein